MDYSLCIAILALLLSALSLWLSFQKYSYERRVYLADRVQELKSVCAETIESLEEGVNSIKQNTLICKRGNDSFSHILTKQLELKRVYSSMYSNMENTTQKNPVVLKSVYEDMLRLLKTCKELKSGIKKILDSCQTCKVSVDKNSIPDGCANETCSEMKTNKGC